MVSCQLLMFVPPSPFWTSAFVLYGSTSRRDLFNSTTNGRRYSIL